ncbi:MAG: phosphoenolpyruvate--protein phosphotransferase [Gemmatimonadota bacterium]
MSRVIEGVGAAPGRALGSVAWLDADVPRVAHRTIGPEEVESEIRRFEAARAEALADIGRLRSATAERLGEFEAKVFDSQALMIEDPELVEGTIAYIRDNYLSAERAFDWHILEIRVQILDSALAMVLDRLADLDDIRARVLSHLLGGSAPRPWESAEVVEGILVAQDITPSVAARLDPGRVRGFVTAGGSRGSHAVLLARSMGIPAVVGVGPRVTEIRGEGSVLIDGSTGRITLGPSEEEVVAFERATLARDRRRARLEESGGRPAVTKDGVTIVVQANLDQPDDVTAAVALGAQGVGLFRTEFLVIGRRVIPSEQEQYEAYRRVAEAFPGHEVTLRTFDIGGDKFPLFLAMPPEENPYLGWRAIRVCLDLPDLFQNQLCAAVKAAAHGDVRIMLPFVAIVDEIRRTREMLQEVYESMAPEAKPLPVGVMIETPAAVETLDLLASHVDFLSLGTNDLTQYVMAADRGNAKLAGLYDPLHPALVRVYGRCVSDSERHGLDLSVCGALASDPVGACVLIGLGYRRFSLALSAIPEIAEIMRCVSAGDLRELLRECGRAENGREIRFPFERYLAECGVEDLLSSGGLSDG